MERAAIPARTRVGPKPTPRDTRRLAALDLRRTWPSLAAGGVAAMLLVKLAFSAGGYFPTGYLPVGALAFAALAVILGAHLPRWTFSTHALFSVGCLAALGAWTGLSASWSSNPAGAIADLEQDAMYLALFALGVVAAGSGRHARLIPWTVLGVIALVCGAGLLSRLLPDVVHAPVDNTSLTRGRLAYPLTYWNTFGGMAAMGMVLGLGLAADAGASPLARAIAGAIVVPLGVAVWFSLSRGSWLALIVGVTVLALIGHRRGSVLVTFAVVLGSTALAVMRLQSYDVLTDHPFARGAQSAGHEYFGQMLVLTIGCGVVMALVAGVRSSGTVMDLGGRVLRPVAIGLTGLVVVTACMVYVVDQRAVEGHSADRGHALSAWISRQWDDFLRPTTFSQGGTSRLKSAKGGRSDLYRVAIDGFQANPLRGDGSSGFTARWFRERTVRDDVVDAHSLELQTLGELGLVGILLLGGFIGSLALAGSRARRSPGALARAQSAAVLSAFAVWCVHSAVDWDWQMPAFTAAALVLAAALLPVGHHRVRRSTS